LFEFCANCLRLAAPRVATVMGFAALTPSCEAKHGV
jgi:hypothetical protein